MPDRADGSCVLQEKPSKSDREDARELWEKLNGAALEQHPFFPPRAGATERLFLLRRGDLPVAVACVNENRSHGFDIATLSFGPLFVDVEAAVEAVTALREHYVKRAFALLVIGLGCPANTVSAEVERRLEGQLPVRTVDDDDRNWASIGVDLTPSPEQLLKGMSKGHRSGIRKSLREGFEVEAAGQAENIETFVDLMLRMHAARGNEIDPAGEAERIRAVAGFLRQQELGELLLVRAPSGEYVGGALIAWQGRVARYYAGAADPDVRGSAVLHPALFEAMCRARRRGCTFFDLWGYNHHVGEDDPRHRINRFKKGFGATFVDYPRTLFIPLGLRGKVYLTLRDAKSRLTG